MAKRKQVDWEAIRIEWDLGQLAVAEIARQFGLKSHGAILNRAKRHGWPERPPCPAIVTALVTNYTREAETVTTPRIALLSFQRCMELLLYHRKQLGTLSKSVEQAEILAHTWLMERQLSGQPFKIHEVRDYALAINTCVQSAAKLQPLQRRAFGLTDQDGPSEFDGLTTEEQEAVEQTFRKALGLPAKDVPEA